MMKLFGNNASNQHYDSDSSDESSDSSDDEMNSVVDSITCGHNNDDNNNHDYDDDDDDDNDNNTDNSKQTFGNRSKWDAFFGMNDKIVSNSYSDDHDDSSVSSRSVSTTGSSVYSMFTGKGRHTDDDDDDDDDSEYESDAENVNPVNLKSSRNKNQTKESGVLNIQKGEGSSENVSTLTTSVFSDYFNKINNSDTPNAKAFTLIPIGNAAQAQYMFISPTKTDGTNADQILTPQSVRSVTLKKGIRNNNASTSKKIYRATTPRDKKFLNINPKKLEQKYDEFKEKRRKAEEERREEKAKLKEIEAENERRAEAEDEAVSCGDNIFSTAATCAPSEIDSVDRKNDSQGTEEVSFVKTMSRLFFPEDQEEAAPNTKVENNNIEQGKKSPSSILKSRSRSIGKRKKEKVHSAVKDSPGKGVKGDKRGLISKLKSRSQSFSRNRSLNNSDSGEKGGKSCLPLLGSRSRSQSQSMSMSMSKEIPQIKISSSSLSKIEIERKKSDIGQDSTTAQDYVVNDATRSRSTPMEALKNVFKLKKRQNHGSADSIDTNPSESSMRKTMLAPNKIRSIIQTPAKKKEPTMKVGDEVLNEMVYYYYFGGDPKKSMQNVKKKESLVPEKDSDEVLIRIEASTVSKTDCYVRHGRLWTGKGKDILPIIPGVDFVGDVIHCGEGASKTYGIQTNDRVAALIQSGGNSKYIVEHANQLVKVPKKLKAADAVIMVEVYLSAFQALLFGVTGEERYCSRPLEGKEILILGGISTVNQAMIELGIFLGAKEVYTTAVDKHEDFLRDMGANVLDISIENWLPEVKGRMDIVVDSHCDDHYESPYKAVNSNGKLICHGMQTLLNEEPGCMTSLEEIWAHTRSKYMSQTYRYDVYSYWEANLEESKADLAFLFTLLQKRAINPIVADTVPLRKVSKAHSFLEAPRRIQGTFVCLPHSEG